MSLDASIASARPAAIGGGHQAGYDHFPYGGMQFDMERAIAYLRVSTQRQQRSGLGIDAQRSAIERFAASESITIAAEFVEAETGKGSDALDRRPSWQPPWPPQRPPSAA